MKKKTLQITNNDKKWLGLIAVIVGVIFILLGSYFWGWLFSIVGILYYLSYVKKENIKEKNWLKKYKIVLILIVLVLFAGCINNSTKSSDSIIKETQEIEKEPKVQETTKRCYVGDVCYLSSGSGNDVAVAISKEAQNRLTDASVAKDEYGFRQVFLEGDAFIVQTNTKVRVLDSTWTLKQVRILEGEYINKAVWLPYEWVVPE